MRPRLHARLCNEIALLSSLHQLNKDPTTSDTTSNTPPDPWNLVTKLIVNASHTSISQLDRFVRDVTLISLRNAASYAQAYLTTRDDDELAWAPMTRILDTIWSQLDSHIQYLASNESDVLVIAATHLPYIIGLTRALDDACVPLPKSIIVKAIQWLDSVSGPNAHLLLANISKTLLRMDSDVSGQIHKRLTSLWTRAPFCPESIHARALGLVRNALGLYLINYHVVLGDYNLKPIGHLADHSPLFVSTCSMFASAPGQESGFNSDSLFRFSSLDRSMAFATTNHGLANLSSSPNTGPRNFRFIWDKLVSAGGLRDLTMLKTALPSDRLKHLTTLCLHHCLACISSNLVWNKALPTDILVTDLISCTLAWTVSDANLDTLVQILVSIFRPCDTEFSTSEENPTKSLCLINRQIPTSINSTGQHAQADYPNISVLIATVDCLSLVTLALSCTKFDNQTSTITQIQTFVMDLLMKPHPMFLFQHPNDLLGTFRNACARTLAQTAKFLPDGRVPTLLYELIRNANGDVSQIKLDNCTSAVEAIVRSVRRPDTFDTAIPFLTRLLLLGNQNSNTKPNLSDISSESTDGNHMFELVAAGENMLLDTRTCLDHLAAIATSAPLDTFTEISKFIAKYANNTYQGPACKSVLAMVKTMSTHITDPDQRRVILATVLKSFTDKSTKALEQVAAKNIDADDSRKYVAHLMPLIAQFSRSVYGHHGPDNDYRNNEVALDAKPNVAVRTTLFTNVCPSDTTLMSHLRGAWQAIVALGIVSVDDRETVDATADLASSTPLPTVSPTIPGLIIAAIDPSPNVRLAQLLKSPLSLTASLLPEQAFHILIGYYYLCCRAADMRVDPVAVLVRSLDEEGSKPSGLVFSVWHAVLQNVIDTFYLSAAARAKPLRSMSRLAELTLKLIDGSAHMHAQVAQSCSELLRRVVLVYPTVVLSPNIAKYLTDVSSPKESVAAEILRAQVLQRINSVNYLSPPHIVAVLANCLVQSPTRSVSHILTKLPQSWIAEFTWHLIHWSSACAVATRITPHDKTALSDRCRKILDAKDGQVVAHDMAALVFETAAVLCYGHSVKGPSNMLLLRYVVHLPLRVFTQQSVKSGIAAWHAVISSHPDLESSLLLILERCWHLDIVDKHYGPFSNTKYAPGGDVPSFNPLANNIHYTGERYSVEVSTEEHQLSAALDVIDFLGDRLSANLTSMSPSLIRLLLACTHHDRLSQHPESRCARFALATVALQAALHPACTPDARHLLHTQVLHCALMWFSLQPSWTRQCTISVERLRAFLEAARTTFRAATNAISNGSTSPKAGTSTEYKLLELLLAHEIETLLIWGSPEDPPVIPNDVYTLLYAAASFSSASWRTYARIAWNVNPALAFQLAARFCNPPALTLEIEALIVSHASSPSVHKCPEAIPFLLTQANISNDVPALRYLSYWVPLPPVQAIPLLMPMYHHPLVLQYALRSLTAYPIKSVFFFVPQIVQALRHDSLGYIQKFVMRTAHSSPVFAHQIIWNMKANMYRDEAGLEPDPLQPLFEELIDKIIKSFSTEDESFYRREFDFFDKITSISGKLKPFIKRSKAEKKKKIDEELGQIKADAGCYLPSNPESTVIDIDYNSGKPLQSHAKAPFLATFKIERTSPLPPYRKETVWQSSIFKVGDDCRQDVLALQLIAVFKSVFAAAKLDLYLYPYRVVATAPGCGVIEVIPASQSRDMIGREKINSLFDYFVSKFGPPHMEPFRKAQYNFITSVAGYSVIMYLLQIKDRHNGNIMLNDQGHLLHIDFGFILDISPGGINFESAPFKLTTEMLQIIGQVGSESFRTFVRCVVKAFLAIRPYADSIISLVHLMSESGLPCFKGEPTLRKLRQRFVLEKSQRDAARYMLDRIADSYENRRTVLYDRFQKQTNGIPY